MAFTVNERYEIDDLSKFGEPHLKLHDRIEISLNVNLLLIELILDTEDGPWIKEFLYYHPQAALELLGKANPISSRIFILTARNSWDKDGCRDRKYLAVTRVYKAKDESNQDAFIFETQDGLKIVDSFLTDSEEGLHDIELVFFKGS